MTSLSSAAYALPTSIQQEGSQFGDTRVSGGVLVQGNMVGLTINATASARADYMGHYAHGSFRPVKTFVERPELRVQIRKLLARDGNETQGKHHSNVMAVWGLGGMGKTQLVLDYLQRHRSDYKATVWIEASQKSTIERDFVNIYRLLFNIPLSAGGDRQDRLTEAVLRVKSWFSQTKERWLIVFDGADSVDVPDDREYVDLPFFMPESSTVDIIITSRSKTVQQLATLGDVNVGEMDRSQAAELFYKASTLIASSSKIEEEVRHIVDELGYLALAVTLAGTYVRETPRLRSNISGYLTEYRRRRRELLQRRPTRLVHQYSESVLTTWETLYYAIHEQDPAASVLMTILSFLSFDDIFPQLFGIGRQPERRGSIDEAARKSSILTWDIYKLEECFEIMQRYSFIQWKEDQQSYGMHKLVHAWGYDRLTEDEQREFSRATFQLIVEVINECGNAPEDKLRLVPHVMANFTTLVGSSSALDQSTEGTLDELAGVGMFMNDIGRLGEGCAIEEYVLYEKRRILGEEHPDAISAMNNLASTLRARGQLDKAAKMLQDVLEKWQRILGEEHLDTISVMNNLAITLGEQGQLDKAAKMEKDVLEKRRRILGEEHPATISAMNNLASTLREQGQLNEAAKILQKALEKMRRILGEEHLDTIITMNNLASTLADQGQLDEAAKMRQDVLEKRRRILGEEHPDTISAMNNLASTLRDQGQLDEAMRIVQEVLEKRRHILGEEHPATISAMNNLASTLADKGQLNEAARIKKDVLKKMKRILGEEHPNTMTAMDNLVNTLADQGQLDEATKVAQEVLEKRRRILGEEHPDTITTMNNLANTLREQGQLNEAAKIAQEVLEKRRRILGEEHPATVSAMNNFALALKDRGQLNEAIALLEAAVQRIKRIHGDKHPQTRVAASNLARLSACSTSAQKSDGMNKDKKSRSLYSRVKGMFRGKGDVG